MKKCNKCNKIKGLDEYYLNTNHKPLLYCKSCRKAQVKQHANNITNSPKIIIKEKKCYKCGTNKPSDLFYKNKCKRDGLTNECKECAKTKSIATKKQNKLNPHIEITFKRCSHCKLEKQVNEFNKNQTTRDGYSTECKQCSRDYDKRYRAANKDKVKAAIYNKTYREINKEALAEYHKDYVEKHKNEIMLNQHKWYLENKEEIKERIKAAKKANPLRYNNYTNKRRAKMAGSNAENFSESDIIAIYGNNCVYCGGIFEHIDHYIPLSKGGSHTLENVRPACKRCNLTKSNKTPEQWMEFLKQRKNEENDNEI